MKIKRDTAFTMADVADVFCNPIAILWCIVIIIFAGFGWIEFIKNEEEKDV